MRAQFYFWLVWSMPFKNTQRDQLTSAPNFHLDCKFSCYCFFLLSLSLSLCRAVASVSVLMMFGFSLSLSFTHSFAVVSLTLYFRFISHSTTSLIFCFFFIPFWLYVVMHCVHWKFKHVHYRWVNEHWPFEDLLCERDWKLADTEHTHTAVDLGRF